MVNDSRVISPTYVMNELKVITKIGKIKKMVPRVNTKQLSGILHSLRSMILGRKPFPVTVT